MSLKTALLKHLLRQSKISSCAPIVFQYHGHYKHTQTDKDKWKLGRSTAFAILGSVLVGSATNAKKKGSEGDVTEPGAKREDLPIYTAEEVSKHDNKKSFWVTYKHGVYDVTTFLPSHPGGEQIYNAAGLSIEPFWNVYGMHKTEEVFKLLESYRIGNLHEGDVVDHSDDELWAKEPFRDKRLVVKTAKPFNAEIPPKLQVQHFNTPNELFYVRQHMPVPDLDAEQHKLKVVLVGSSTIVREFSLQDLHRFRPATVNAALMCAGNRRSEMNEVKPVKGLSWTTGAVSNAQWSGVYLRDVLEHCGLDMEDVEGKHVIVKSITVSTEESPSHWHQRDYRSFNPSTTWETADFPAAPPVYSLPVTSAACEPEDGDTVEPVDGHIQVKGISSAPMDLASPIVYAVEMEIWVKATDSNFNTQPEKFDDIWNIRGILSNAYHKIKVNIKR
ncbi:jg2053 [Pararge aegeria aegeria]|uniref:sulfite oxidase n=1 Tax=Pararge aegeria aegeria TaxID=348720 RepID=A0A8S4RFQ9_9NEOP|nr:jg2053 [Pararge aegeria aegeria]